MDSSYARHVKQGSSSLAVGLHSFAGGDNPVEEEGTSNGSMDCHDVGCSGSPDAGVEGDSYYLCEV